MLPLLCHKIKYGGAIPMDKIYYGGVYEPFRFNFLKSSNIVIGTYLQ